MDGTVRDASREEGRPERCGTPDGDGVVVAGAVRGSCLVSADTALPSIGFLCIVLLLAAALEVAVVFAGAAAAGLLLEGLETTADFTAALFVAAGVFLAAVLAAAMSSIAAELNSLSTATVVATHGLLAWLQLPWGLLAAAALALLARISLGLLLAAAWLSPLLLLPMAASAWLKRWGVPVVVLAGLVGTLLIDRRLPAPVVQPALQRMSSEALQALVRLDSLSPGATVQNLDWPSFLAALPAQLISESISLLGRAATPAFVLALAGGALGFALLVLRRQRGA